MIKSDFKGGYLIAKITSGQDISGLIYYHVEKVDKGSATIIGTNNLVSNDPVLWRKSMKIYTEKNPRVTKNTFHVSLNLPPDEKLSDEKFFQIGKEYMDKMGYADQPFVVFRHTDKAHQHIHIVSSRVDYEGKKINDFQENRRSVKITEKLEEKHRLTVVDRTKKTKKQHIIPIEKIKDNPALVKNQISHVLSSVLQKYNLVNMGELKTVLKTGQVGVEKSSGTTAKGEWEGVVYYLTNEKGERATNSVAASKIHYKPTLKNLEKYFLKSQKIKKEARKPVAGEISKVLGKYRHLSFTDFQKILEKNGIVVEYAKNKGGIYGISFLDKKKGVLFKGSELGKDFSWNKLKEKLNSDLTITNRELHRMVTGSYKKILKENLGPFFFESRLLSHFSGKLYPMMMSKLEHELARHPLLREELEKETRALVFSKLEDITGIRQKEIEFVNYCMDSAADTLSTLIHPKEDLGYRVLESLNLRIQPLSKGAGIYHFAEPKLKREKPQQFLNNLGISRFSPGKFETMKPDLLLRKVFRSLVLKSEIPPVLFFSKFQPADCLNEKGQKLYNEKQNTQYIKYKSAILKKKKLSPEQQMLSLLFRGIVPGSDANGNLTGKFFSIKEQPGEAAILGKELTGGYELEDLKIISDNIQKTENLEKRLELNDAIDRKDTYKIRQLSQEGHKPLLPYYEMENLEQEIQDVLCEGLGQGINYKDIVLDIAAEMVGLLEIADHQSVDNTPSKKRKKKRKRSI